jgi:hypothetical protein
MFVNFLFERNFMWNWGGKGLLGKEQGKTLSRQ